MSIIDKPLSSITESDLTGLIANKVVERRGLEYKAALPGNADKDKKEFLADVSSFANAGGGLILYGLNETDGLPTALTGFPPDTIDAEKRRLENIIRDGIAPRIPNITIEGINLGSGSALLGMTVPKSLHSPHMVTYANHAKFFSRNSSGKYQLDVFELKQAFGFSEGLTEKIKGFRLQRVGKIAAGELPVKLLNQPPLILHSVPLSSLDVRTQVDLPSLHGQVAELRPVEYRMGRGPSGWSDGYNLDGYFTYSSGGDGTADALMQIFRNGIIEVVDGFLFHDDGKRLPYIVMEEVIIDNVKRMIDLQRRLLGLTAPFVVFVSILGIRGYTIVLDNAWSTKKGTIAEKDLLLPEVIIENPEINYDSALRPICDMIWNAAGWSQSLNYNDDGTRKPSR